MNRFIAILAGVLISGAAFGQLYGDPSRYQSRADVAPAGTVTGVAGVDFPCGAAFPFGPGYSGSYLALGISGLSSFSFIYNADGTADVTIVNPSGEWGFNGFSIVPGSNALVGVLRDSNNQPVAAVKICTGLTYAVGSTMKVRAVFDNGSLLAPDIINECGSHPIEQSQCFQRFVRQ